MKYLSGLLVVLVVTAVIAVSSQMGAQSPLPQRQLYVNARIVTMDAARPEAEAMLLERDRIVWVGSNAEAEQHESLTTTVHDMEGKTLAPGFIDAHGHFPGSGLAALSADLNSPPIGTVRTIADIQSRLRARLPEAGDWLLGIGYDDSLLREQRHPSRQDLDQVSVERPIFIMHISGHMGVANSAALALAGIDRDSPDPEGGRIVRDDTGEPTGLLLETAAAPVQALAMDFSVADFFTMIDVAARDYLRAGVTTAQSGGVDARMLQGLWLASMLRRVPQRLEVWPLWDAMGERLLAEEADIQRYQSERFRVGALKMMVDGSIQGYTGYLGQPYYRPYQGDADYRGFPHLNIEQLTSPVGAAQRAGYQLALHGNGDAAIDMILDALAETREEIADRDLRPIIVHAQMARDDQLRRMKQLGATPSFFSAHTYYWGDRHRDIFMGPERAARMSPTRSAAELGLRYSVHLDTPVVPMDPVLLLWSTVNRESASGAVIGADQRVTVEQALRAMTLDAAWQIHREGDLGSLSPGKLADFVVLDRYPLAIPAGELNQIRVLQTYIGGRRFY